MSTASENQDFDGAPAGPPDGMSYADYLRLDQLLTAQHPRSRPVAHDELLFIVQHQTSELWLKLMVHELVGAKQSFRDDDVPMALKRLARVKHILATLTDQWAVLATLTPSEYAEFRGSLASSSGFQSYQYRCVEFLLGSKDAKLIALFDNEPLAQAALVELLQSTSLYDEFLRHLSRFGHAVPDDVLSRSLTDPHCFSEGLVQVLKDIYDAPSANWVAYECCEVLVDIEDAFQLWRFRHLRTVSRMIGHKMGTGGSSGVPFLKKALDRTFFPEIYAVRSVID